MTKATTPVYTFTLAHFESANIIAIVGYLGVKPLTTLFPTEDTVLKLEDATTLENISCPFAEGEPYRAHLVREKAVTALSDLGFPEVMSVTKPDGFAVSVMECGDRNAFYIAYGISKMAMRMPKKQSNGSNGASQHPGPNPQRHHPQH